MSLFHQHLDLPEPDKQILTDEEMKVVERFAKWIVRRNMVAPAIMALESVKPLNFIMSQGMIMVEPLAQPMMQIFFRFEEYEVVREALEKRGTLEILLQTIEAYSAVAMAREKRVKKYMKLQRKNWKWHQRWLGIGCPKVQIPEDVLNPPPKDTAANSPDNS